MQNLRRRSSLLLPLLSFLCTGVFGSAPDHTAHLRILHWNDFHAANTSWKTATGMVGGAATLLSCLRAYGGGKPDVAVFNAGDDFQGTPISSITSGKSQITILNLLSPDAVVPGNHEFDYGASTLIDDLRDATYPVICANIVDSSGSPLFTPWLVRTFGGTTVGIIGLTHPDLPLLVMKGALGSLHVISPDTALSLYVPLLRNVRHVNLIVVLSHMGLDNDTLIAGRHHDIDVIIGGHSHTALDAPVRKNRTIICQAGSSGRYLGVLDIVADLDGDSVVSYHGQLVETTAGRYPPDSTAATVVEHLEQRVSRELGQVIGTLHQDMGLSPEGEPALGDWEADIFRAFAGTDIGIMNAGGLRRELSAGPITRRDIFDVNPFGNTLVTFHASGGEILRMLDRQVTPGPGTMSFSGLSYAVALRPDGRGHVVSATIGGKPVDSTAAYSIVTNNYISGHMEPLLGFREDTRRVIDLGAIDRDVVIAHVVRVGTIVPPVPDRRRTDPVHVGP